VQGNDVSIDEPACAMKAEIVKDCPKDSQVRLTARHSVSIFCITVVARETLTIFVVAKPDKRA